MNNTTSSRPLLIVGSGQDIYREYILAALAEDQPVALLAADPVPEWTARYVTRSLAVDPSDQQALLQAAGEIASNGGVSGVMTYDEMVVEATALLAAHLGLPGNAPAVAHLCRDKAAMRSAWEDAKVLSARSHHVSKLNEALDRAEEIGYPVVLKPRSLAGSVGVVRVDGPDELRDVWSRAADSHHPKFGAAAGLLVEEYLDGPEVSVESVIHDGVWRPIVITRKQLGQPPGFEEIGHVVSAAEDDPRDEQVLSVAGAAHAALGIRCGVTHAELRLTERGPRMVEIGARLAGDLIPLLVRLATGIDLPRVAGQVACGEQPDLRPIRRSAAAIRFFYPPTDCRVRSLGQDLDPTPSWLERLVWKSRPGDTLLLPPRGFLARLGFAIVTGANRQECQERLDHVEASLRLDLEPVGEPASAGP